MNEPQAAKKKVAILGGGAGAMSAAYYLSSTAELRAALDVTVYQIGWRLGGKGASGRNAAVANRIEEHGLHVWGGFYYNAFRLMQDCYGALGRPEGAPLRTWDEAFRPHPFVTWQEQVDGRFATWPVPSATNDGVPGEGARLPSVWEYIEMLVGWIKAAVFAFPHTSVLQALTDAVGERHHFVHLASIFGGSASLAPPAPPTPADVFERVHAEVRSAASTGAPALRASDHSLILILLDTLARWLAHAAERAVAEDNEARRLFVLADLGFAAARGMIADGIDQHGFMAIDDYDLTEWLGRHGATELALQSAPLRGFYDYFFAYENGDRSRPRMSAGMGLLHLLRVVGEYKGALFWKMQSGMGDACFGPIYEMCKRNGVTFRFFHEVLDLAVAADGTRVETIRIGRQADLAPGRAEYDPLQVVNGLPSWPSEPLFAQLDPAQAAAIQARGANLEDPWTNWAPVGTLEMHAGVDFDAAVLGISIGAFPGICSDLIAKSSDWREMVANLQTIQTQALQLWWKPDVGRLGWPMGNTTGTAYGQPFESWSDMSGVIPREDWPAGEEPQAIVYFCGPMLNPPGMPQGPDPGYGAGQTQLAEANAYAWCQSYLAHLYPASVAPDDPRALRFDLLCDIANQTGEARFAAQYVRANYTPSERYVLDLPGTARYRLEANTSGFTNLALAGDWLFTGLGGAVESAVMSGMQAARGLCGLPATVPGEVPSPWPRPRTLKRLV